MRKLNQEEVFRVRSLKIYPPAQKITVFGRV